MASIGSRRAAFLAGYQPKKTPVKVQTAKLMMMLQGSICVATCRNCCSPTDRLTPNSTPTTRKGMLLNRTTLPTGSLPSGKR